MVRAGGRRDRRRGRAPSTGAQVLHRRLEVDSRREKGEEDGGAPSIGARVLNSRFEGLEFGGHGADVRALPDSRTMA